MRKTASLTIFLLCMPLLLLSAADAEQEGLKVAIIKNATEAPLVMAEGGLIPMLEKMGCSISGVDTVTLTPAERKEYGAWNLDALESRHIGRLVSKNRLNDGLIIGLLTNCTDLMGMLAGLQHLQPERHPAAADERSLQRD